MPTTLLPLLTDDNNLLRPELWGARMPGFKRSQALAVGVEGP